MPDTPQNAANPSHDIAWVLALASFIPFLVLAGVMVAAGNHNAWSVYAADGFKTWSAVMLSFLGGIRWGLVLRHEPVSPWSLVLAMVPAAVGWAALFAPDIAGIAVLLLAQCAQGAWDSISAQRGIAPRWFGNIRIVWTLLVVAAHIAAFVAIY